MDLLDLLIYAPGRSRESRVEEAAKNIALWLLPMAALGILIPTGLWRAPAVSLLVFPLLFAGIASVVCRRLRIGSDYTTRLVLGCAFWCFAGAVAMFVLDVAIFPF